MVFVPGHGLSDKLSVSVGQIEQFHRCRMVNVRCRYFVIGNLADNDEDVVRFAGLLRGTESAVQAVSVCLSRTSVEAQAYR